MSFLISFVLFASLPNRRRNRRRRGRERGRERECKEEDNASEKSPGAAASPSVLHTLQDEIAELFARL